MYLFAIIIGRALRFAIRRVRRGGGSALPGLVISRIAPGILRRNLRSFPQGVVLVTGSAGKSTTTKMLVAIARAHGLQVFTNPSTANILQGFYATIVEKGDWFGRIRADMAILELDEGHALRLAELATPRGVVVLNVMEDQLDRFVEPALVREKLVATAATAAEFCVLNAEDQNLLLLAEHLSLPPTWIGVDPELLAQQAHGLGFAPTYLPLRDRPVPVAEVRRLEGSRATIFAAGTSTQVDLPNRGLHFALDAVAALAAAERVFELAFDLQLATKVLNELPPVFARGERVQVAGQAMEFILVQNPMSFQLNLDYLQPRPERLMIAIGRDVHDPSWLWTVDYSGLDRVDVVSGFNASEMALLLAYHEIEFDNVDPDLAAAMKRFVELPAPTSGVKTVLFSADAMRRLRRALGFTSPEAVTR